MKNLIKKILPPRLLRGLQRMYYERGQLDFTLTSGVHIEVLSHVDWCLYNDIFVDGEYDKPIETLVSLARGGRQELRILDLGANVGFFLLRVLDRLGAEGLRPNLFVGAVEPDPLNIEEMNRRLGEQEAYRAGRCQLHLVRGLAGKREGAAVFKQTHSYHAGKVVERPAGARRSEAQLNYVDLDQTFGEQPWDLVKCDIEGSEDEFVDNYSHLLSQTRSLVIELHHGECDCESITAHLLKYGLHHKAAIAERKANSVHLFGRPQQRPVSFSDTLLA
jgi:FkbM family methyltransferase